MNKEKSKLDKLKEFFAITPELENLEVVEKQANSKVKKFEDVTLADGIVVSVEPALEAGAMITTIVEDVVIPAPVGEHPLEDGRVIVVTEEGIVAEVKEVETEVVEEAIEEEMGNEQAVTPQAKKVIESIVKEHVFEALKPLTDRNAHLEKENDLLKESFAELKENTGEALKELFSEPVKEPIKKKKNVFKKEETNIFIKK
tara:strand:+ start:777 stop:1379 length:603 start_codon:yes stop_codon:yes gene_type:complete